MPRDQWMIWRLRLIIEWSNECSFDLYHVFSQSTKISFAMKTKHTLSLPKIYKAWNFLTIQLQQYCKSGRTFPCSKPVASSKDCCRIGNTICLCLPVLLARQHRWAQALGVSQSAAFADGNNLLSQGKCSALVYESKVWMLCKFWAVTTTDSCDQKLGSFLWHDS